MNTQHIRGFKPLQTPMLAAAATLVFTGIFIFLAFVSPQITSADLVVNVAPTAIPATFTVVEGSLYSGIVSGADDDGDSLTFALVNSPALGILTLNADGSFTYSAHRQPNTGFEETDSFTFVVNDGTQSSEPAAVSVTITAINDAPVAHTDSFTVDAGQVYSGNVTASDTDTDTLTFEQLSSPMYGSLNFSAPSGTFTYTADADYSGADSFTFKANDGLVDSEPATISVTITGVVAVDSDADGISDDIDNCPEIANDNQIDTDGDLLGDACDTDTDGDGVENTIDNCPATANPAQEDTDGDGVGDACDNCQMVSNANQLDSNDDAVGDACEVTTIDEVLDEVLIDEVLSGSLSEWAVNYPSGNPAFTYEETVSPYDGSTALRTSVVGNSYSPCNQPNISRIYPVGGNTDTTQLRAYLAFTSTMEQYTFPYVAVEAYDASEEVVGSQVYYGQDVIGGLYTDYANNNPESYTELSTAAGDVTLDLSVMGENIDFTSLKLTLINYACVGQTSVTFDHLRVVNGIFGQSESNEVDDLEFDFIDPTPASGAYILNNTPQFTIQANNALSSAYLTFGLPNGGFELGDLTNYQTTGTSNWRIDDTVYHDGSYSARSGGPMGNHANSQLTRTVEINNDGTVSFWWKVSSEGGFDFLRFYIDDVHQAGIAGEVGWTQVSFPITAGVHQLRWTYSKDFSVTSGSDAGWVDDITINGGVGGEGIAMTIDEEDDTIAFHEVSPLTEGIHYYQVVAYDLANNEQTSESRNVSIDMLSPDVLITDPSNDSMISGVTTIRSTASDIGSYVDNMCAWYENDGTHSPVGFDNCKTLSERDLESTESTPTFSFDWDTTFLDEGAYSLYTVATDASGHVATSSPVLVNVDNPPHVVSAVYMVPTIVVITFNEELQNDVEGHHPSVHDFRVYRQAEGEEIVISDVSSVDNVVTLRLETPIYDEDAPIYQVLPSERTIIDLAGNQITEVIEGEIVKGDKTPPVITLNGNASVLVTRGDSYRDAGAVAIDDVDGALTVAVTGNVNTDVIGVYTITYTAIDAAGNIGVQTREIKVVRESSSTSTRIGQRPTSPQSGAVLGATTDSVDEPQNLLRQREIVRLLEQVVRLLQQLIANQK